ncbi:MAG: DsrH/TusB family sulfur metabolism protein [Methanocellales archaeon]
MKNIVFMLTKAPSGRREPEEALRLAIEAIKDGNKASIYLFSDAVFYAKRKQKAIEEAIALGARIYAAREELLSRGLNENYLIKGIEIPDDIIKVFIEDVMERADSVWSF